MVTPDEAFSILSKGTAQIISAEELKQKLKLKRPLKVKLGVDPTAPDIHLGHTVALQKLRQFQDLGHEAVLIIGDFTAMIGDPSGRSATRPQLTHDQVMENAKSYREQAFKILDPQKTKTVFNGEWFEIMTFDEVIKLNTRVTIQQMLQREDFKERLKKEQPIAASEIQYPIMQAWDSVKVQADVEIGGTDQLFNILLGRDLQREEGMPQQVALLVPILEGLDGVQKMSKSLGNYVAVNEAPDAMFGKLMSVSDELMDRYYLLLLGEERDKSAHPMEAKKELARKIVARYHSEAEAQKARTLFEDRSKDKDKAEWPKVSLPAPGADILTVIVDIYSGAFQLKKSRSDARRLVEQGSVQLRGEKIADVKALVEFSKGDVLKLDKTRAVRFE